MMALCTVYQTFPFADILQKPEPDLSHIKTHRGKNKNCFPHHASLEALTQASEEGCPLCSRLSKSLGFVYWDDIQFPLVVYAIERQRQDLNASARCTVGTPGIEFAETYQWSNTRSHWTLSFYVVPVAGSPGPLITRSVPWPTVEDAAKEWLRACGEKHPRCSPPGDRPLPTRVIDVGDKDSSRVRLFIPHGQLGRYVALSHCWGYREPTTTTRDSLDTHIEEGIEISDLPQTFRDAVEVVRALDLQYLWIDCLCIVQQDGEDWRREAARMPEVYANAAVTVASCVQDAYVGFLNESSWNPHAICQFDVQWKNADSATTIAILEEPNRKGWQEHFYPEDGEPWNLRAWTLQERLLSARILYFANSKLFYECSTARFSRSCNSPLTLESVHEDSTIVTQTALQEPDINALMGMWYRIVADYSRRHLTKGQDRFAAIPGVARFIAKKVRSEYWAGLWASEFFYGLLWKSSYPIREMKAWSTSYTYRPVSQFEAKYPGPSWSWAACDHGVMYPDDAPRHTCMAWSQWAGSVEKIEPDVLALCCELLKNDIKPLDDAFGSIEEGTLIMIGAVRGIEIGSFWGSDFAHKANDPIGNLGEYAGDYKWVKYNPYGMIDRAELPVEPEMVSVPVAVWRRHASKRRHAHNDSELSFFAWVLRRDNSIKATYRRVGSIEGSSPSNLLWLLGGVRERLVVM